MKKFSDFLSEAATSRASDEAKRGLSHVGCSYYGLPDGTVTHRSVNGKLVELSPERRRAAKNGQPPEQKGQPNQHLQKGEGEGDKGAVSITFGRFNPPTVGHEKLIERVARVFQWWRI